MFKSLSRSALCALLLATGISTSAVAQLSETRINELYGYAGQQLSAMESSIGSRYVPEKTSGGSWQLRDASSWISGFYAGNLWQMYQITGDDSWRVAAENRTAILRGQEYNDSNHDVGFRVFNSFGQGYKSLSGGSVQADYKSRVLTAANTLASRYNSSYNAIESWDGDRVIIDNMMNLELLMWAADNGASNADQLRTIANNHAMTTINQHIRSNGSTYHVVEFYPSGSVESKYTHQGYANESTWSRGQAWGMYGFTSMYRFTDNQLYLDTAMRLSDYFIDELADNGVPAYDFDDPNQSLLDSSAGAIAAAGMLELSTYFDGELADKYFNAAEKILTGLAEYATTEDSNYPSILLDGSVRKGDHELGLIYGDYYFLEALQRYQQIVPEPTTIFLLAAGAAAIRRRRRI